MAEHKEPKTVTPPAPAPAPQLVPLTEYQGKKIVARRPSRAGDDGYQLSTAYEQVTIIFDDGSEKVVNSSDLMVDKATIK